MKKSMLKKVTAIAASVALSVSGITAFAASSGHNEGEYGTKYIYSKYFKFNSDSDIFKKKLANMEGFAAHISSNQSYSGTHSMYMDCCNTWWKQWFHTNYGCEIKSGAGVTEQSETVRYVNPKGKTFRFQCRIAGDFSHIIPNAGLCDTTGLKVKFSNMTCSKIEEKNGTTWRTYTWEGAWPGTGWMMGMSGTHACGSYIDDVVLEYKSGNSYKTIIEEDFEDAINVDLRTVNMAAANPIDDTAIRISWKNPELSELTKLEITDITNEENPESVLSLTNASTDLPENVNLTIGSNCYYDIEGLSEKTYKKYKIVTSTDRYSDIETVVEGRTLRSGENMTDYNYDENGFSFGGSWQANIGDNKYGSGVKTGKWYLDFNEKRSGAACFANNLSGAESRLEWSMQGTTFEAGKTYGFEWYAKTADEMPPASSSVFILTSGKTYAAAGGRIGDGEWTRYSYEWTPEETVRGTRIRLCFFSSYPTTVYADDLRLYEKDGGDIISAMYSEPGHALSNAGVDLSESGAFLTWDETTLDGKGVDGLGVNIYYTNENGTEIKLNSEPIQWTGKAGAVSNLFALEQLNRGIYTIKAVSEFGAEDKGTSYEQAEMNITEGTFKNVYAWTNGFSEIGYGTDLAIDIQTLEKGDIMGSVIVGNYMQNPLTVSLIGALYKDGRLLKTVINPANVAIGENKEIAVAFQVGSEEESNAEGYTMKMFLWNSAQGMIPINGEPDVINGPKGI